MSRRLRASQVAEQRVEVTKWSGKQNTKTTTNIVYAAIALVLRVCFAFSPQARAICQRGCDTTNNKKNQRYKYWEMIGDNLREKGQSLAGSQPGILSGERSGLWTPITTESALFFAVINY